MNGTEAVFAFDANSALTVYPNLEAARRAVAACALTDPHTGIYTAEGVPLRLRGRELRLGHDGPRLSALQWRLAEYQRHLPVMPAEVDVVAFAAVWLASNQG